MKKSTKVKSKWDSFLKVLGPGILMAGAAIGVSHIVQSTRAGADYGFSLLWVLALACLSKYPFMEFGARYTAATGKDLVTGYKSLGKYAYWSYFGINLGSMFIIQAAVTIVTAGLAEELFNFGWSPITWYVLVLLLCMVILLIGKYSGLDFTIKIIIVTLTIATLSAVIMAFFSGNLPRVINHPAPSYWNIPGFIFVIAFMGWMPIPIDASVWYSLWAKEKTQVTGQKPSIKNTLVDFNVGYLSAAILGLLFLCLGALMMFGSGESFSTNSVTFSTQLIALYNNTLGGWSSTIIAIAAFATMFSTTLTVTDAYPRVMERFALDFTKSEKKKNNRFFYKLSIFIIPVVSLFVFFISGDNFTTIIDFSAGLSFIASAILAWLNYKLVTHKEFSKKLKPSKTYRIFSQICLWILVVFTLTYLIFSIFIAS